MYLEISRSLGQDTGDAAEVVEAGLGDDRQDKQNKAVSNDYDKAN